MPYKRKKYHHGDTHLKKRWRLRNRRKDLDEIDQDLKEENAEKLLNQEEDLDVPGAAQHYCLHCARYFIDEQALNEHFKTKVHKRRLKALELKPYSIEESERAAGHGNFKLPNKRKITSQNADKKENLDNDGDVILDNVPARNSALFVNGPKTQEIFRYVTPQVDYDEIVKKKQTLIEQIERRKLDFDFKKLENLWNVYLELKQRKMEMDNKRLEIIKEIGKLIESKAEDKHKNKLIMQSNFLKENIYKLKIPLWSAEESAMLEALSLPNILHADTPDGENKVIFTYLTPPSVNKDHLEIGRKLKILEFTKNENYYFKGDAALFELGSKFYFNRTLRRSKFIQLSNPDFVKSVVIEGCGGEHTNPDSTFILHHNEDSKMNVDNRLHLVGGGSLYSFFAYHCKNVLYKKVLPLKYFTMGRQYIPAPLEEDSLFHVSQSSVVQFFGAAANREESEKLMEEVIEILKDTYRPFGYHFQLSYLSADKLFLWESLRVRLEMFSTSLGKYVEIANVSMSGDFISKRLMFVYKEREDKERRFPYIISGTFLNVPRFLACVLEQESNFSLPEAFKTNNWEI